MDKIRMEKLRSELIQFAGFHCEDWNLTDFRANNRMIKIIDKELKKSD